MSNAIIFGANGQDGYYLRQLLEASKIRVRSVSRSEGSWTRGDVGDRELVRSLIQSDMPDMIFHLAANSSVSHELLWEHQHTILKGTLNILECVYEFSPRSAVFITGSGLQFENKGEPIKATDPFFAGDCYSMARIQSVYAARYYREKGMTVKTGYLFHHDSPFRKARHLNRMIVDAAQAVKKGKKTELEIGDITVEKEFGYAGDIAKGIFQLMQQNELQEACIGTGKAWPVEKWLDTCFSLAGANWKDHVNIGTDFIPSFKRLVADPSDMEKIGWKAEVDIETLANLMMKS